MVGRSDAAKRGGKREGEECVVVMCAHNSREVRDSMSETTNGTLLGYDSQMQPLRIGDRVDHTEKGFTEGVITEGGLFYKEEPACRVDFADGPKNWLARLSKLEKLPEPEKTVQDFGFEPGEVVHQIKYDLMLTIDSDKVGEYRGEPCCFTNGGRPTRFSQIEKVAQKVEEPEQKETAAAGQTLRITLPNGGIILIDII